MVSVRPAAVAGLFYPNEPTALAGMVRRFLDEAPGKATHPPKALIAPHAGFIYSGPVAATAYRRLAAAGNAIKRVVLLGPSHRVPFRGIAATTADAYSTPLGPVMIDRCAVERAAALQGVRILDEAHAPEHSVEVHLPFLQQSLGSFTLVPLVVGAAAPETVAAVLDALWDGPETLIVVSTDLSHYHDYETARRLDAATSAAIERLDGDAIERDHACGRIPIQGLLAQARRLGLEVETVDLRNSGDTAGSRDRVVGYGAYVLGEPRHAGTESEADAIGGHGEVLLRIGREAIDHGLRTGRAPIIDRDHPYPPVFREPRATFVTLKREGRLRGCVGSIVPCRPLVEDVAHNAFAAAFDDPRFPRLSRAEFAGLAIQVSLLGPAEPLTVASETDLLERIRPGIDGLILENGSHRGVFLPAVWEQLPDPAQFLARLKIKAGLPADYWSDAITISRFTTTAIAAAPGAAA